VETQAENHQNNPLGCRTITGLTPAFFFTRKRIHTAQGTIMLGEALRLLRVYHDMKAGELAIKLGISPSYLSEIEREKKTPSVALIEKYAEVFKTRPSAIMFFYEQLDDMTEKQPRSVGSKFKSRLRNTGRSKILKLLQVIENAAS
jgi:transcriptional regulator with XRE-family HTH domain